MSEFLPQPCECMLRVHGVEGRLSLALDAAFDRRARIQHAIRWIGRTASGGAFSRGQDGRCDTQAPCFRRERQKR